MPPVESMGRNERMPTLDGVQPKTTTQAFVRNSSTQHQMDPASLKDPEREMPVPEIEKPKEVKAPVYVIHPEDPDYKEAMAQVVPALEEGGPLDQALEHLGSEALGPVGGGFSHIVDLLEEVEGGSNSKQPRGPSVESIRGTWE